MRAAAPAPPSADPPLPSYAKYVRSWRGPAAVTERPPPPPPARDSEPAPRPGRAGLLRAARMAEPLRRTLGRLRERHAPGALGLHADSAAASLAEGRSPLHELAGPGMERPARGTEQSGARVPWSRRAQEAAAMGRAFARASPGTGGGGDEGEDEGADYYENLPAGCAPEGAEALRASPSRAAGSSPGMEGGRLETGMLQTQLREAYYLLIQAMQRPAP